MSVELSPFDLLIVGGGINGAGIARDAAGRGLKVALFEQGDLAGQTSSRSTKLIHGGLRYLEYYEFRLVREALQEREVLLAIAPHITGQLRFVLPHTPYIRPAWMIRLGLFLYDWLGGRISLPASQSLKLAGTTFGKPLKKNYRRGFAYSDGWVDDARLVVLNALDAQERGAQIHTRTKVISAQRTGPLWSVRVQPEDGPPRTVLARALVNAAGPWVDQVKEMACATREPAGLRLIKGSHVVLRKLYEGEHAYALQNPDKRVFFAIPYQGEFTLIGTTEIAFEGDTAKVEASSEEIAYLCDSANRFFERQIGPKDVVWSYAGIRPLYDDKAGSASAVTRDYVLNIDVVPDGPPILSVYGGKITTYRRLAEHAFEKLLPKLAVKSGEPWTGTKPLPGGETGLDAVIDQLTHRYPFLSGPMARRLAKTYGTRACQVLGEAKTLGDLGKSFGGGLTEAETRYLIDKEWARAADDVLWRRTKLGLHMTAAEMAEFRNWFAENSRAA